MYKIKENLSFKNALNLINKLLESFVEHDMDGEEIVYIFIDFNATTNLYLSDLIDGVILYIKEHLIDGRLDISTLFGLMYEKYNKELNYDGIKKIVSI